MSCSLTTPKPKCWRAKKICPGRRRKSSPWARRRWSSSTGNTARRFFFAKAHLVWAAILFARPLSRSMKSKIQPERGIPSPADSWAISRQEELNREVLKRALFYGGVMGSFAVESFGTERLQGLTREHIDERFEIFRELTHLE